MPKEKKEVLEAEFNDLCEEITNEMRKLLD